uniref:Tc1-like transposase DDE domain-containing protein n=1 Tax=Amphimedon queenslandica TaxID=400682 RepID=A0A1X7UKD7_AMPQE
MNVAGSIEVFENGLILYTQHLNLSPRFMQDNDRKHSSKKVKEWLEANKIIWWKTPPESPYLNPIENQWHELKEYVRRVVKPQRKEELVKAIMDFSEICHCVRLFIILYDTVLGVAFYSRFLVSGGYLLLSPEE